MTFENLLNKLDPKIRGIARKLNYRYTYFDDDDLYQEALTHLWQKHESGDFTDKTESYILQGCYFFLKNYIRKTYKNLDRKLLSLDTAGDNTGVNLAEKISDTESADSFSLIDARLAWGDLEQILSAREKNILSMQMEGFTTREIGATLGVSHVMVVKIEKKIKGKYTRNFERFFFN